MHVEMFVTSPAQTVRHLRGESEIWLDTVINWNYILNFFEEVINVTWYSDVVVIDIC